MCGRRQILSNIADSTRSGILITSSSRHQRGLRCDGQLGIRIVRLGRLCLIRYHHESLDSPRPLHSTRHPTSSFHPFLPRPPPLSHLPSYFSHIALPILHILFFHFSPLSSHLFLIERDIRQRERVNLQRSRGTPRQPL
jgi:hypothetical protein